MSVSISQDQFNRTLIACGSSAQSGQYEGLLRAIGKAGISSQLELAMFLGNVYHESGGLVYVSEISPSEGYSGGIRYKGRGYIQLTHDYNYRDASVGLYGDLRLLDNPDMVQNDLNIAWDVTAWFWKIRVKPQLTDDFLSTVQVINSTEIYPGSQQLERRKRYFEAVKAILQAGGGSNPVPTGGFIEHVVQPGESLYLIGQKYGVDYNKIARDNNIQSPSLIQPSMSLKIYK